MRLLCPHTARRLYRDANAPIMTALAFAAYQKQLGTIDDIIKELKLTKVSCPCCQSDLLVKVHDGKLSVKIPKKIFCLCLMNAINAVFL